MVSHEGGKRERTGVHAPVCSSCVDDPRARAGVRHAHRLRRPPTRGRRRSRRVAPQHARIGRDERRGTARRSGRRGSGCASARWNSSAWNIGEPVCETNTPPRHEARGGTRRRTPPRTGRSAGPTASDPSTMIASNASLVLGNERGAVREHHARARVVERTVRQRRHQLTAHTDDLLVDLAHHDLVTVRA